MALLKEWQKIAYDEKKDKGALQRFWANYFNLEKGVYEKLLSDPDTEVKGTVKELAEKYNQEVLTMVGFLDGINERFPRPLLPYSVSSSFITIGNRVVAFKPAKMIDSETIV